MSCAWVSEGLVVLDYPQVFNHKSRAATIKRVAEKMRYDCESKEADGTRDFERNE